MDAELYSLLGALAMRSCSGGNPVAQALLAGSGFSGEAISDEELQARIARISENNPALGLMLQSSFRNTPEGGTVEDKSDRDSGPSSRKEWAFQDMREKVEAMYRELEELREITGMVAAAVGACPCFGRDPCCTSCGGTGSPGAYVPDPEAFSIIVKPALPKIRERSAGLKNKNGTTVEDHRQPAGSN